MVAGLIYAVINMNTVYTEVSKLNVNQLPYLIQNYVFPPKPEVAEGQEADKKGGTEGTGDVDNSFTVMKRGSTTTPAASKLNKS